MKQLIWIPLLVLTAVVFWFLGSTRGREEAVAKAPAGAVPAPPAQIPSSVAAPPSAPPMPPGLEPPPGMPPGLAQQFLESRARNRDMMMQPFDMLLQDLGVEAGARAAAMAALQEHDDAVAARMAASLPPNGKPPTIAEMQAQDRARDAKLKAALGEEGFAEYQANVDTIPERLALATLENRLKQAGVPLTDQQAGEALNAMVQAARSGTTPLPSTVPDPGQFPAQSFASKNPTQRFEDVSAALTQSSANLTPSSRPSSASSSPRPKNSAATCRASAAERPPGCGRRRWSLASDTRDQETHEAHPRQSSLCLRRMAGLHFGLGGHWRAPQPW